MINLPKFKIPELIHFNDESDEQPLRDELFNMEQQAQHARTLASEQKLTTGSNSNFLLNRLNHNDTILRDFNYTILAVKKTYHITPATEWLIDNFYLIEEHIQLARRHFPKRYSKELPCLAEGASQGLPRVYDIVFEFISHADAQIDEESLHAFFEAYQTQSILKLGELWAIPIMLRLALIENLQRIATRIRVDQRHRDTANSWVDKLQLMAGKSPSRLIEIVADMAKSGIPLTSAFVAEFCQRLSSQNPMLHMARSWLEQRLAEEGLSIEELIHTEGQKQAANQVSVSHSIGSLRFLGTADWKIFVEKLSLVNRTLKKDPVGIYSQMDFTTQDRYRHVVETFARHSLLAEVEVAQQAIRLSTEAFKLGLDKRQAHVGFYLIGDGQNILARAVKMKWFFCCNYRTCHSPFPIEFLYG